MNSKTSEILKHILDKDFDFDAAIKEVDELRLAYRKQGDEEKANAAWALKTLLIIHRDFRRAYSLLKEKQYYEAWRLMEDIEISVDNLLRNCPGALNAVKYISLMNYFLSI